ncbi:MAG: hypothetical protein ACK5IC_02290 [Moheibacter sp.]
MKKLFFPFAIISALFVTSCSSDDDDNGGTTETADGIITSVTDVDFNPSKLEGSVQGNITLNASTAYTLTGALTVEDGYTLTIEAGTVVKAEAGGTDVYIAIKQGAKIDAQGTASAPIKFTSATTAPTAGDWGGIMIIGKAKTNAGSEAMTEVAGIAYGGDNDADNSGVLKYIITEYTGARIDGLSEFNGITFYAVGSETTVENIVVRHTDDDGIEFFGGTVDVNNVLIVNNKDDMFDWTEGYTGTLTNLYGIREAGYEDVTEDPRGIEGDSNSNNNAATPVAFPTINNISIVNKSSITMSDAIKIRRGSGAIISNAYIYSSASGFSDVIDLSDSSGDAAPTTNIDYTVEGGLDGSDVNNPVEATLTESTSNSGTATSVFSWTGYSF